MKLFDAAYEAVQGMRERYLGWRRPFEDMPPARQRVEIMRDTIAALNSRRITPTTGTYVNLEGVVAPWADGELELGELLKARRRSCAVCELGALFVAAVERADELKVKDATASLCTSLNSETVREYLERWFDARQMDLLEAAFEKWLVTDDGVLKPYEVEALNFTRFPGNAEERMREIAANVIRNRGELDPRQIPGVTYDCNKGETTDG